MTHATDTARAILKALIDAHSAGETPHAIVLDAVTQESLQAVGLGYWSAGPGTWSLFKVPVVIGRVSSWQLRFSSEMDMAA